MSRVWNIGAIAVIVALVISAGVGMRLIVASTMKFIRFIIVDSGEGVCDCEYAVSDGSVSDSSSRGGMNS